MIKTRSLGSRDSFRDFELEQYATNVLERWIRLVIKRRAIVIAIWMAITVVGVVAASQLNGLLTTSLTVPSSSSAQANAKRMSLVH